MQILLSTGCEVMEVGTVVSCQKYGAGVVVEDLGMGEQFKLVDWFCGEKSVIGSAWVSESVYKQTRDKGYKKVKVWKLQGMKEMHLIHVLSEVKK